MKQTFETIEQALARVAEIDALMGFPDNRVLANKRRLIQYEMNVEVNNGIIVLRESHERINSSGDTLRYFVFKCHCGNEFTSQMSKVKNGHTSSCGCKRLSFLKSRGKLLPDIKIKTSEDITRKKLNDVYYDIKKRCYNKNCSRYGDYGGRGIKICSEWLNDKNEFFKYVSNLDNFLEKGYSIDRIDVNGNYEPNNVRWASDHVQAANQRKRSVNTSGYVGVWWSNQRNKWLSYIRVNGVNIYNGASTDLREAVSFRNKYIIENNLTEYAIQ